MSGDKVPQGRIRRSARVSAAVGGQGARVAGTLARNVATRRDDDAAAEALVRRHIEAAERMVDVLGSMKGAAMKLGQMLSFIESDFVPEEYRPLYQEKLAVLRDAAPQMPLAAVEKVLREEWDDPPGRVLADIDESAAAASVGQVHRAVLRDGREVAVKVQYPGIAEAIRADLQNVGLIVAVAKVLFPGLDARAIATEIRERVSEELDYELEADFQRRFARAYRDHPFAFVPPVMSELSRRRVLVSEWVDGDSFDVVRAGTQEERDRFGEIVYRFGYGSMHRAGLLNADPHPGNWIRRPDGSVAALDFGACKAVDRERLALMSETCLAAVAGDDDAVLQGIIDLGYLARPDRATAARIMESVQASSWWILVDREVTIDPALVREVIAASSDPRSGFFDVMRIGRMPPEDLLFRRLDASIVSVLGQLRATANWYRMALEYWRDDAPATDLGQADRDHWLRRYGQDAPGSRQPPVSPL